MNCGSQMPHSCFAASKRRVLERKEDGGVTGRRPDQRKITRKRNTRGAPFGCHSGRVSIK